MPFLLGLTGNIASGKTTVSEIFRDRGIPVIDSDYVVHELYTKDRSVQNKVLALLGTLDRREIAAIVFASGAEATEKRKKLEAIIHPAVDEYIQKWVQDLESAHPILVNEVPLLFEAGLVLAGASGCTANIGADVCAASTVGFGAVAGFASTTGLGAKWSAIGGSDVLSMSSRRSVVMLLVRSVQLTC